MWKNLKMFAKAGFFIIILREDLSKKDEILKYV
jgi:hypothetical protein